MSYKSRLMAAVAAFSMVTAAGAAYAQSAPTAPLAAEARFDIPAQDLGAALMAFSRIAGVAVSADPALTRGRQSVAIEGRMRAEDALKQMLSAAPLTVEAINGAIVLRERPLAAADEVDALIVVGYAAGLRKSLDAKRDADMITDVVSANDMGKLPSSNLTEAVSRLPGVSAVRNHTTGEGDRISIRGLATEYNTYSVNGVRLGGMGSPGDNFYRGVRLSFLPAAGVDSITVFKSILPNMDGDALGGSVEIRTPTAFDFDPTHLAVSLEGTMLDKRDRKKSGEAQLAFGRQFNENFGVFVTASYSRRNSQFEQVGGSGDDMPQRWFVTNKSRDFDTSTFQTLGVELSAGETKVERKGLNASLDWRNADHEVHLRGQYNVYDETEFRNRLNFRNYADRISERLVQKDKSRTDLMTPDKAVIGVENGVRVYSYSINDIVDQNKDGRITDADRKTKSFYSLDGASGLWDPQGFRLRRYWEGGSTEGVLGSATLGGKSRFGDLTVDYDVSYSNSRDNIKDEFELQFRTDAYNWLGNKGVFVSTAGDPRFPKWVLNAAGMAAVQDPAAFKYSGMTAGFGENEETLKQAQFNLAYASTSDWLRELKAGVKMSVSERRKTGGSFIDLTRSGTMADFSPYFGQSIDNLFGGVYSGQYRLGVTIDTDKMMAELRKAQGRQSSFFSGLATSPDAAEVSNEDTWNYKETVLAGYAMAKAQFGKAEVITGARVESTKNDIQAWLEDPLKGDTFTRDKSDFVNVLPSIHTNYKFRDNLILRGAIWTSFSRPDINRMSSAKSYGYNTDPNGDGKTDPKDQWVLESISTGNPNLKPMKAVNYDASLEWYNGKTGAYSVGLFHKDIRNFLFRSSSSVIQDGTTANYTDGTGVDISTPMNGKSAKVTGVEVNARQILHWLPAPFDGLGVAANMTFQRARAVTGISWHPAGLELPLMETPERLANLEVFWERNGWEAYVSYSYQSESLEDIEDYGNDPYEQDYKFVDLMVRRHFNDRMAATFKVQNALDSHTYWYTFGKAKGGIRDYIENGRYISLSFDWKL